MEKMNITNQEHDAFVKSHPNGDLLQLSKWADTKKLTGWYSRRIAVGENGEIKGVGQLLFKKIPKLPFTLCYISRGFVTDYNNKEAFEEYWRKRKELTKDKDWKDVDSKIKDTIEYNLNVELKKSGIDIKEVSNNLADDILSIHEGDMKQRNYLINEGRKVWKSPGDDIMINSVDLTQVSIDLTDFVNLVNTGKPLDLKSRNYNDELEFSLWSRKWEGNLRDDYLGNYLFGYVAKGYLGMEDEQIKNYAGLAQLASDKDVVKFFKNKSNGNFGDNEGDASAIQDGIDSYEENNK